MIKTISWFGIFFACCISYLASSCIQQVNLDVYKTQRKLVVNSIIGCYDNIKVKVSGLQSILDSSVMIIENATVVIDVNNRIDTLRYNPADGFYHTHLYALPGDILCLNVWLDGYPTVTACDTMPHSVKILDASLTESVTIDEFGERHDDYTLTFEKEAGELNYYEFFMAFHSWNADDSVCRVSFARDAVTVDPLISSSNSNEFNFCTYLFNDSDWTGGRYTLHMKMNKGQWGSGEYKLPLLHDCPKTCRAVVLRTVSRAYYDYQNAWGKHNRHKNDDKKIDDIIYLPILGEPTEMFSNVENGFGVFVTYNQEYFIVK